MRTSSGPPPAAAGGWPTPISSVRSKKYFTVYGEEVKFGGGKVIRDGMGQSQITNKQGAVDTVISNALILDYGGVVRSAASRGGNAAGLRHIGR